MRARVFFTDQFVLPLPPGHRFLMEKYRLLRDRIRRADLVPPAAWAIPDAITDAQLALVHSPAYLAAVRRGELDARAQRRIGFPWSPQLVERSRRSVGATLAAARSALRCGSAVNLAGGTHHAFADRGEGYCVFNDVAVAVRVLQREGRVRRALVIDCDVHQGNGTAAIFADDPSVYTLDCFAQGNFPFEKVRADQDVAFQDLTGDGEYLDALHEALCRALPRARPDLACYVAGADPYADDRIGRLSLTKAGLRERDQLVVDTLRAHGVPVVVVMAGGYGRHVVDTVDIHFDTVRIALGG